MIVTMEVIVIRVRMKHQQIYLLPEIYPFLHDRRTGCITGAYHKEFDD